MPNKQGRIVKTITTKDGDILMDEEDYEFISKFFSIYVNRGRTGNRVMANAVLPRIVMRMQKGDGLVVDHINGNPLDNRKENLRVVNRFQNVLNTKKRSWRGEMSSRYKGVFYIKSSGKWKVSIAEGGSRYTLGHYKSEEFAAYMYDYAACNLFGQYARTNGLYIPPSPEQFGLRESA